MTNIIIAKCIRRLIDNNTYKDRVIAFNRSALYIMTSSYKTFSALLSFCEGNPPVTWNFDVFFDLRLNKRLSKQSGRRWFDTPSHSLWRQCNDHGADVWVTCDMKHTTVCESLRRLQNQRLIFFGIISVKATQKCIVNDFCSAMFFSISDTRIVFLAYDSIFVIHLNG